MKAIPINTPFIKLDQLLKLTDICRSGGEAKILIQDGKIRVNGEIEIRRGRKIKDEDLVSYGKREWLVRQDGGLDGDKKASS